MTPDPTSPPASYRRPTVARLANSHYARLGVRPSASAAEIRRAYRDLSKRYHPDTTDLAAEVATLKFQQLNEAYATLSNPERRALYDAQIGYAPTIAPLTAQQPAAVPPRDSAYLDPSDRPLSAGEIFALFAIAVTFVLCLLLALAVAIWRGDPLFLEDLGQAGAIAATLAQEGS